MKRAELWRSVKFLLFSCSAGLIELGSFALFNEVLHWPYWAAYLLALVLLRRDELSYPSGDSLKRQWLADDICAVTYVSRSDGISYDNMFSACYGSWSCRRRSTSRKMTPTTGSRPPISAATTGRI